MSAHACTHVTWKGDLRLYKKHHHHVSVERGKPQHCEKCGATGPGHAYQWANRSGDYANPADYSRLCQTCHRRQDMDRLRQGDLSAAEARARLQMCRTEFYRLLREGVIEARRITPGRRSAWRITEQAITDYLARQAS